MGREGVCVKRWKQMGNRIYLKTDVCRGGGVVSWDAFEVGQKDDVAVGMEHKVIALIRFPSLNNPG